MKHRSLDDFLQSGARNEWVKEPGFEHLYVRYGPRYINNKLYPKVLDLATIEAKKPGEGTFTKLVEKLHKRGFHLYVESVLEERFANKLFSMGFSATQNPCCYFLLAEEKRS